MSDNEEAKKQKKARRRNPAQYMKRGDDKFYAINSVLVEEPIMACLKWGKPCEPKDEKLTLSNICWFYTPKNGVRRLLRNSENKLRIPGDAEMIKLYRKTKKEAGATISIKGVEVEVFDPRWDKLKKTLPKKSSDKKKDLPKKKTSKRKAQDDENETKRIAALESELKKLKKKKKKK